MNVNVFMLGGEGRRIHGSIKRVRFGVKTERCGQDLTIRGMLVSKTEVFPETSIHPCVVWENVLGEEKVLFPHRKTTKLNR